jgi:hypothetical protein
MIESLAAWFVLWSFRVFRVLHGGTRVLFEGFWMGLIPDSVADLATERSYGAGDEYTNRTYLESGFHFWEELAVSRFFSPGCKVLVAAAGGGREMIALASAGFHADGFECSRAMVVSGRKALAERNINGRLDRAPPCKTPDIQEIYEALIVGWNGYTYIAPRARRVAFMKTLKKYLKPGSPVLVSAAFRSGGKNGSAAWIFRVANMVRRCTFRAGVFETGDTFPMRPRHEFNRRQIESELSEAGFSVSAFYRWGPFGAVVCHA